MIHFGCPKCRLALTAHEGTEGKRSQCRCGQKFVVPGKRIEDLPDHIKRRRTDVRMLAIPILDADEPPSPADAQLQHDIELICEKQRMLEESERERVRQQPHPLGLVSIWLAIVSGFFFFIAWVSDPFPLNAALVPAVGTSLLAMLAGKMCQAFSKRKDDRGDLGAMIGMLVFSVLFVCVLAKADRNGLHAFAHGFAGQVKKN